MEKQIKLLVVDDNQALASEISCIYEYTAGSTSGGDSSKRKRSTGNDKVGTSQCDHCRLDHAADGWILFAGKVGNRGIWRNAQSDYALSSQQ